MNRKLLMIIIVIFIIAISTIIFFSMKGSSNNAKEAITENAIIDPSANVTTDPSVNSMTNSSIVLTEKDKQILINHIKSIEDPEDRAFYIKRFYCTKFINTRRSTCSILIKIGFLFRNPILV